MYKVVKDNEHILSSTKVKHKKKQTWAEICTLVFYFLVIYRGMSFFLYFPLFDII